MNSINLVGRIANDLTIKHHEEGKTSLYLTIAVKRSFKNSKGEIESDFIKCVLWNGIANSTIDHCSKGDQISLSGRLQVRTYLDTHEENRFVSEVIVEKIQFLNTKKTESNEIPQVEIDV